MSVTDVVVWAATAAGVVTFLMGVLEWFESRSAKSKVKHAADSAGVVATEQNASPENLARHGSVDFKGQWEALAALAKALKDLDASTRLLVVSLAFLGVSGATAGLEAIGTGLGTS